MQKQPFDGLSAVSGFYPNKVEGLYWKIPTFLYQEIVIPAVVAEGALEPSKTTIYVFPDA